MSGAAPRRAVAAAALSALMSVPAAAQTSSGFTDLPQGFRLDVGGFRIASETQLKYDLAGQGQTIDFEGETGLPSNATTIWLDGTWRLGRRHQLALNYTRVEPQRRQDPAARDPLGRPGVPGRYQRRDRGG